MRVILWTSLIVGGLGLAAGLIHYLSLQPQLSQVPAIVIVPQMIQAVLVCGFSAMAMIGGAAGLAVLEAAERHQAALDRIARHVDRT